MLLLREWRCLCFVRVWAGSRSSEYYTADGSLMLCIKQMILILTQSPKSIVYSVQWSQTQNQNYSILTWLLWLSFRVQYSQKASNTLQSLIFEECRYYRFHTERIISLNIVSKARTYCLLAAFITIKDQHTDTYFILHTYLTQSYNSQGQQVAGEVGWINFFGHMSHVSTIPSKVI